MRIKSLLLVGGILLMALTNICQADVVAINNHSFETGAGVPTPGNWNNNTPDGWSAFGSKGMQSDAVNPAGIDGNVFGFLEGGAAGDLTGGTFSQDITAAIGGSTNIGDIFTLTLAATSQNASPSFDFDIRTAADPLTGSSLIGGAVASSPPLSGGGIWGDRVVIGTVSTASSSVWLIINTNGPQVRVDNVRLDLVSAVPEPGTFGLLGIGMAALGLRRRR